jgi:hypothetical protein
MFKFIQSGKDCLVKYPDGEVRTLTSNEIENFYQRINSVIDILGLKEAYYKAKEQQDIYLIDFARDNDIDLDACLYAVITNFRLEKPLV